MAGKKNGKDGKANPQEDLEQKDPTKEGYQVVPKPEETAAEESSEENPEETVPENPIALKLSGAVKEVTDEIERCDKEIEKLDRKKEEVLARKEKHCQQLQEAVNDMQSRFGFQPDASDPEPKKSRTRSKDSIKDLILLYLQKNGQARTIHIRQFLTAKGRKTNPGVELSRLVKEKVIRNVERGVYEMIK